MIDEEPVGVLDVGAFLNRNSTPTEGELIVRLKHPYDGFAIRVDRALEVFQARRSELRNSPEGLFEVTSDLPFVGFSPWAKLSASLVRGALLANNMALSRLSARGSLKKRESSLYAGGTLLNGDKNLVDDVSNSTGYGCTIFLGNIAISTTAHRAGSQVRALGSRASEEITESVLRRGREFRGLTRTIGKEWAIVYRPLIDSSHHGVGMVATYREVSSRLFPVLDAVGLVSTLKS
jgi:hypothetical protein